MKRQTLTKEDIKKDLLLQFQTGKKYFIALSVIALVLIPFCIWFLFNFSDLMDNYPDPYDGHIYHHPIFGLFICPVLIVLLLWVLFNVFIDWYRIKKGKFTVIQDSLYTHKKEVIDYYKLSRQENSLYFRQGRIAVKKDVYDYTKDGDKFYIVIVRNRKAPYLVYHTKYYDFVDEQ